MGGDVMNAGLVILVALVAVLCKVAFDAVTSKKEHKCDGNCGENCKCKDK